MRCIIAGSRDLFRLEQVLPAITAAAKALEAVAEEPISLIVCGCADGVDQIGFQWARYRGLPVRFMPAWARQFDWALTVRLGGEEVVEPNYGGSKSAGYKRNAAMAGWAANGGGDEAGACICIWNGKSAGTKHMYEQAQKHDLWLHREIMEPPPIFNGFSGRVMPPHVAVFSIDPAAAQAARQAGMEQAKRGCPAELWAAYADCVYLAALKHMYFMTDEVWPIFIERYGKEVYDSLTFGQKSALGPFMIWVAVPNGWVKKESDEPSKQRSHHEKIQGCWESLIYQG